MIQDEDRGCLTKVRRGSATRDAAGTAARARRKVPAPSLVRAWTRASAAQGCLARLVFITPWCTMGPLHASRRAAASCRDHARPGPARKPGLRLNG